MSTVLVVAPHPDDETLGCGGAILRHRAQGDEAHWLIVTDMTAAMGATRERIAARTDEIDTVKAHYGFANVHRLGFPATRLDTLARGDLVTALAAVVSEVAPETLYIPFCGDVHSDHAVVADACIAASKAFRQPTIRRIRAYETLSETEFQIAPGMPAFRPNLFVDISAHLEGKVAAMRLYASEMGQFPFPRSEEAIRSLARYRGLAVGCTAAEAFMTLREIDSMQT